jgi:hypothetical protein
VAEQEVVEQAAAQQEQQDALAQPDAAGGLWQDDVAEKEGVPEDEGAKQDEVPAVILPDGERPKSRTELEEKIYYAVVCS